MHWLSIFRLVTFGITAFICLIVLSLSADLCTLIGPFAALTFAPLSLTTSLLTLLTIIPMFIIDRYRQGTYFSFIVVEIACLSVLWVLWLASGSDAAATSSVFDIATGSGCSSLRGVVSQACSETKAVTAFAFLEWILLSVYISILLGMSLRARGRGHSPWLKAVSDDVLFLPAEKAAASPAQVSAPPATVPQPEPSLPSLPPTGTGTAFRGYPEI